MKKCCFSFFRVYDLKILSKPLQISTRSNKPTIGARNFVAPHIDARIYVFCFLQKSPKNLHFQMKYLCFSGLIVTRFLR